MNTRTRALLWEEFWTGVPIAGTCLFAGLISQVALFASVLGRGGQTWHQVDSMMMTVTLGVPLIVALLLTLNIANSGHMSGGFSRRILRLPVDTWTAVTVSFLVRLGLVLLVGAIITGICRLMFAHGPGFRTVLVVAGIYLFIQVLDWSRAVVAFLVPVALAVAIGLLVTYVGGLNDWGNALTSGATTATFLACFAVWVLLVYGVSLGLAAKARCGDRFFEIALPVFDRALPARRAKQAGAFTSPLTAQVWFELRRSAISYPVMVIGAWLFAIAVRCLMTYSLAQRDISFHESLMRGLDQTWTLEILPYLALILAALAWSIRMKRAHATKGRREGFMLRLPLHKKDMAKARLIVAAINLAVCLGIVTVVAAASLLLADNGFFVRVAAEALARHETSLRELAVILVGPSILAGVVTWFLMLAAPGKTKGAILIVSVVVAVGVVVADSVAKSVNVHMSDWLLYLLFPVVALPTAFLAADLLTTWRRGLITRRSVLLCLLAWAIVTAIFFPFSIDRHEFETKAFLIMSLAVGALAVSPLVNMTLAFAYRSGEPDTSEKPPRGSDKGLQPLVLGLLTVPLLAVAGLVIWMQWSAEPAWQQAWRARGLPATLEELNSWYTLPPPGENLANRYLQAAAKDRGAEQRWKVEKLKGMATPDDLLIFGTAGLRRAKPISEKLWQTTNDYWETVARSICPVLHAAAQSGLKESRYPVDFTRGWAMDMSHLAPLRDLARSLMLEALEASVARQPETAANAVLDILPIGDSLANEPSIISTLVRFTIYTMSLSTLEDSMNRLEFSDGDLARIDARFAHLLPPLKETRIFDRPMTAEQLILLNNIRLCILYQGVAENSLLEPFLEEGAVALFSLSGTDKLNDLALNSLFVRTRACAAEVARKGMIEPPPAPLARPQRDEYWSSQLYARAFLVWMFMPAVDRCYESEWRIRTRIDLARTAISVERFRMANGHLPARLDELVPEYIDTIPGDLWNGGHELSYRVKENGEFVVYSYFENFKDDQGQESTDGRMIGPDLTFTVAPVEVRNRPQVVAAAQAAAS